MADTRLKLEQLRNWMASQNIDVYLVPHSDRFQSEYLLASEERLEWLTGFSGSHGMVAVLEEKAALFTSGIYTIQAGLQVDKSLYEIIESPPGNPMNWLAEKLDEKAIIGFDPMLFTVAQIAAWRKATADKDWQFLPIEENAIDQFWLDKKPDPVIKAQIQEIEFTGATTADKIARILDKKSKDAGYLLITEPSLVCWLLNMRGRDVAHTPIVQSLALLDKEGQVTLFADPQKITPALHGIWGNHVGVEPLHRLYDVLTKIDQPLQIDPVQTPYAVKSFCTKQNIKLLETTDPAILIRAAKNEVEIRGAEKAHVVDAQAFKQFTAWLKARDFKSEKITELDIVQNLHEARLATGQCVDESFETIAGFGPNGAIIHYRAKEETNLTLQEGSLLLLDSGGQYRYGTTDVTRVFAIGKPTQQMKTHYTTVLKGLIDLSRVRFPVGTSGGQLDTLARAPIWSLGLDYAHGTGHGVGSYLSVHEWPRAAFNTRDPYGFQPGMILSIEPGIYLEGQYGIRLENLVVVVEDKREGDVKDMLAFKTLTKIPFEDDLIDFDMLDEAEKAFLKQFN